MKLKDLAEHLQLSQTTVSRALNGYPEVAEETRQRIVEAARQFGYRPNAAARRLATGRTGSVAILFPAERNLLVDPHFSDFLAGLAEKFGEADMDLSLKATRKADELETYRRLTTMGRVDGFIVSSPRSHDERLSLLAGLNVPFAVHGRSQDGLTFPFFDIDNEGAFRRATDLLLDLGHERIALLNGIRDLNFARAREEGFRSALAERGISAEPELIFNGPMVEELGYRQTCRLIDRPSRPTALLAASVLLAFGAYRAARDRGLAIGKDISIIAHDDGLPFLKAETLEPPLAATVSSIRNGGYRLAEILLERIAGKPVSELQEIAPVDLVFRSSVGSARK